MESARRIAVLGLGRSGAAVVRWALARRAAGEDVTVSAFVEHDTDALRRSADELRGLGAEVVLGSSEVPDAGFDLIVASPGIAPSRPIMVSALRLEVPIVSEIELAYRVTSAPVVAVTGTNGKTTTTALVAHLLQAGGRPAVAVGNIGTLGVPAIEAAVSEPDWVLVCECSSFQLALTSTFRPKVSVLLNITPDHIDWHGSMAAYVADKARIFANQGEGDTAIVDVDDVGSAPFADSVERSGVRVVRVSRTHAPGSAAYVEDGRLVLRVDGEPVALLGEDDMRIAGQHNVSNALAAAAAASAMGVGVDALREGLRSFAPIEHRLEPAGAVAGVDYVNDSKATNPDAVLKALTAFGARPVIVLLGGRNKGNDFSELAAACAARCRTVVLYGECATDLEAAFSALRAPHLRAGGMAEALRVAAERADAGDVILLSPACASFDEFSDYEDRGRTFKALVAAMSGDTAR